MIFILDCQQVGNERMWQIVTVTCWDQNEKQHKEVGGMTNTQKEP